MNIKLTDEEYANLFLKQFFDIEYKRNQLLFDNLPNIYTMVRYLAHNMEKEETEFDFRKASKISFLESTKLIDSFYKSININFKTDDIVNSGVFKIIRTNSPEEASDYELTSGNNDYIDGDNGIRHKAVNVYNNGLVTDTIIWVHEISHYRNQPERNRGPVNDMLTELLAFTEEFIYMDYLEKVGYKDDVEEFKIKEYQNFYNIINVSYHAIIRICLLYFKLGEVSKEDYKNYYGEDDNYEKAIEIFVREIKNNKKIIFTILWYSIAVISIYNYEKYKEDSSFLEKINKLNDSLNTDISLEDALKIIDIKLDKESLDKILQSINNLKEEITKKNTRIKRV